MNAAIQIFDFDLNWKGMLDGVVSLTHKTSWHEIVNSELTVDVWAAGAQELQIGRVLVVNNQTDKALIIEDITRNLNEPTMKITCIPLKGLLNWRICHPTDTLTFTARKQSEIMMIIPFNNLVQQTRDNDRKFWSSAGAAGGKNMFGVTGLKVYGETIDFLVDWKTGYIGDAVVSISKMYAAGGHPIGWNIYINSSWTQFVMDTYQATNRSINQTTYSPVVFSEEFGNIKNATYNKNNKDWRNVAYMLYTDTANAAQTLAVGNTKQGATIGFNRKEIIIDSSKNTTPQVGAEANSELNKRLMVESFTAEIINNTATMSTYGTDWNLGDIVTIQSKDLQVSVDAQITEITETYAQGEYTLEATFNEGQPNLIQLIKQEIYRRK
jgi:ReqiPepy6 Gp37-like protein